MIQAVVIHGSYGVTKEFKPTGVTGEWELVLYTRGGPEPGGHWQTVDVAQAVVDDLYAVAG